KMNVQLLAYNRDLWAARGLDRPAPDWTWDDLLSVAARIAQKSGDTIEVYGLMQSQRSEVLRNGELNGISQLLADTPPEEVQLGSPEFITAIERTVSLFEEGVVYTPPEYADGSFLHSNDYMPLIREQKLGMWRAGYEQYTPNDSVSFEVGIAPYPPSDWQDRRSYTQGYIMSGGAQYPEQAWRWLDFLSHQATHQTRFADVDDVPARRSVAEMSGYWDQLDAEGRAAVETTLARQSDDPILSDSRRQQTWMVYQALNTALGAVLDEGTSPAEALRAAQADLEEQLANTQLAAAASPTAEPDTSPIVVATPLPEVVAAEGATPITFGRLGFGNKQIDQIAKAFNQEFPAFFVTVKTIDQSGNEPLTLNDVAATNDCFAWWRPPKDDEDRAALLDVQPLIDADPSFELGDYPVALLAPFEQDGKRYGLPYDFMFRVLNYNQDAFDAAGLAYPTADWTLNDLMGAAQQLTQGNGADRQYGFVGGGIYDMFFFLARSGVTPITRSDATLAPNFTDPQLQEAVQSHLDFLRTASPHQQLLHYSRNQPQDDLYQLQTEGRAAMWIGFGLDSGRHGPGERPFTLAATAPPMGSGDLQQDDFYPSGVFISADAAQPEGCWQWLKYLSARATGFNNRFPARTSLATSEAFLDQAPAGAAEVYAAYQAAFARTTNPAESFYQPEMNYFWFGRAVDRAFQGADLAAELAEAQFLTEQFLACTRDGAEADVCTTQVDPTYERFNQP
ncbi:MAG: extracellular solute-binding protein, partial [Chloroflexales bacterium]|nr:extracellular solute-binding protein [Chloroflexales bacterium]